MKQASLNPAALPNQKGTTARRTAELAAAYVSGAQRNGVVATHKPWKRR